MPKTLQTRYAERLLRHGFTEQRPTSQYRVFTGVWPSYTGGSPTAPDASSRLMWVYLGRSGAIRFNRTGKVSKGTLAINNASPFYREILTTQSLLDD
jgi:hypothetical protein